MPAYDFRSPRLFVDAPLGAGANVALERAQAHYLGTVLRLKSGSPVLVFNGRDGEWSASVALQKRTATLVVGAKTREQTSPADLHYLFAPLKSARLDYMVQKAVEMGVSRLQPVLTRHSQVARVNAERMRANAIEAAEQCGILSLPDIEASVAFTRLFAGWDPGATPGVLRRRCRADRSGDRAYRLAALAACRIDRAGRRFCRGRARGVTQAAECGSSFARPPHSAGRHRRGCGAGARSGRYWRLALKPINCAEPGPSGSCRDDRCRRS